VTVILPGGENDDVSIDDRRLEQARFLIVDDEQTNVVLLETVLEQAGYCNVYSTTHSSRVVDMFAPLAPDLLLLDLDMPAPDGLALLHRLDAGRDDPWFRVLALVGDAAPEVKRQARRAGAADFLAKPFDQTEVLLRVRNLLHMHFLQLEMRAFTHDLEKRIWDRTAELAGGRVEALERLAVAAEYRDYDTGEHTRRVGRGAAMIAKRLGMPAEEVDLMAQAAPLHDVGKIGVPDRILLKPAQLTRAEFDLMKRHAGIGGSILSGSESRLLRMSEQIARTHHERWDGSGYPAGLRGEEIPLPGRIVAVADVFDALTHSRPYKEAWPVDVAVGEIVRLAGRGFDPEVVGAFEQIDHEGLLGLPESPRVVNGNGAVPQPVLHQLVH
jgi:putative two-component system response regulator